MLRFKSSVSFGTYTLLDNSSRVQERVAHLPRLITKG